MLSNNASRLNNTVCQWFSLWIESQTRPFCDSAGRANVRAAAGAKEEIKAIKLANLGPSRSQQRLASVVAKVVEETQSRAAGSQRQPLLTSWVTKSRRTPWSRPMTLSPCSASSRINIIASSWAREVQASWSWREYSAQQCSARSSRRSRGSRLASSWWFNFEIYYIIINLTMPTSHTMSDIRPPLQHYAEHRRAVFFCWLALVLPIWSSQIQNAVICKWSRSSWHVAIADSMPYVERRWWMRNCQQTQMPTSQCHMPMPNASAECQTWKTNANIVALDCNTVL